MRSFIIALALAALALAVTPDVWGRIDKPAVVDNLDYLKDDLSKHLPIAAYRSTEWEDDTLPKGCYDITVESGFNPTDVQAFDVRYRDCARPWVFCHHKDTPLNIQSSMATEFGQMPIQMRQYVKHIVSFPGEGGYAFQTGGNIAFFNPTEGMLPIFIHEIGHSLDGNGAYGDSISSSDNYWSNFARDNAVVDPYAQSSMVENVAQNTVIAVYNENVPGKYNGKEPQWYKVFHQYATLITAARKHGKGRSIYKTGQVGSCQHYFSPSVKVRKDDGTGSAPANVGVDESVRVGGGPISKAAKNRKIGAPANASSTNDGCGLSW